MFPRPSRVLRAAAAAAAAAAAPYVYAQAPPTSSSGGREAPVLGEYPLARVPVHPLHLPVPESPLPTKFVCGASQYPANDPIEDRFAFLELDKGKVVLAAVMDGHGGWQASEYARRSLLETVAAELEAAGGADAAAAATATTTKGAGASSGAMAEALSRAFVSVDRSFLSLILPAYNVGFGDLSSVGCCALAAAVLPDAIVVANAGDCRAVLGRTATKPPPGAKADGKPGEWRVTRVGDTGPGGRGASIPSAVSAAAPPLSPSFSSPSPPIYYSALPLSRDHNAREEYEKERLASEHPGEPDIVICKPNTSPAACYVKGRLQPTRALGDGYLKDKRFNPPAGSEKGWGRQVRGTFTPPYVSR
jgi:pyruvate dehydrogenase phosphatase